VNSPAIETAPVLGVRCFLGNLDRAVDALLDLVSTRAGGYVCQGNVHLLVTAQHDAELAAALAEAALVFPDGAPVAWLQRRQGAASARRVAGPDVMAGVLTAGQPRSLRHFFFGATEERLSRLEAALAKSHPGVRVAGSYAPPFAPAPALVNEPTLERIQAAESDVVWCALGAPKQELWMRAAAPHLRPAVLVGVGAAFDFLAGLQPRAPQWMRRAGLEWLHRLAHEPRRLVGRYVTTNAEFVLRAGVAIVGAGRRGATRRSP
jgi:N-acetylglucosaminyldiphosphoundecaprenol N-acetyl-beta-D-mannosaminyltransferase